MRTSRCRFDNKVTATILWGFVLLGHTTPYFHCQAQPINEGLTVNDCETYLQQADLSGNNNGGIGFSNGEYTTFIELLGRRKCYESPGSPSGQQTILFLNVVCTTLNITNCGFGSEIPVFMPEAQLRQVCKKVDDQVISECPTRPPNAANTDFPTFAPSKTPTQMPSKAPSLEPITRGISLDDCRQDVFNADEVPRDLLLTLDEYTTFLELLGQRVCFQPDANAEIARNGTFSQFRCLSNNPCQGAVTIDMTAFDKPEDFWNFCFRSYTLGLSGAQCPTEPPAPTTPKPTASPTEPQPTASPVTPRPTPQPTPQPTRLPTPAPTSRPNASTAPTAISEAGVRNAPTSAAVWIGSCSKWVWTLVLLGGFPFLLL